MFATSRRGILMGAIAAGAIAAAACSSQPTTGSSIPAGEPDLPAVRRATERFMDVKVALAEGYIRDPFDLCDTAEMMGRPATLGAMGVHYFRPDMVGVTAPPNPKVNGTGIHTDFLTPSVLIYEPQADGSMQLVAVENLAFAAAWKAAGHAAPPTFHGVSYNYMVDDPATAIDEAHQFEPHYDRHVWIYRENPNGVFEPFNPKVSCAHHKGATLKTTAHGAAHWEGRLTARRALVRLLARSVTLDPCDPVEPRRASRRRSGAVAMRTTTPWPNR